MSQELVQFTLRNDEDRVVGKLLVVDLPGRHDITLSTDGEVALHEAAVYRYEIDTGATDVEVEPRELFDPDDASYKRGRYR